MNFFGEVAEEKEAMSTLRLLVHLKKKVSSLSPSEVILLGYAGVIFLGALLLSLPFMVAPGNHLSFVDALFTSTSAVCVTGLVVVDTATFFSFWGQLTILILLQIGGLGYMTMTTLVAVALGRRVEYRDRLAIRDSLALDTPGGVVRFVLLIVKYTLLIEGLGFVFLLMRFLKYFPFPRALFAALFHAVSAFCNAGFSVFTNSLENFVEDPFVNLTIAGLIVLGGIGFMVLKELSERRRVTSLHARVVVRMTTLLIAIGFLGFLLLEWNGVLRDLSLSGKLLAALFQSITPRTAGFNTVPISNVSAATALLLMVLMFIGASPGGTGGGIKTTTFAILLGAVKSVIRQEDRVELLHRKVAQLTVYKAFVFFFLAILLVVGATFVLLIIQPNNPIDIVFEVFSAFGTVGLSRGITPHLLTLSKMLIILIMYVGRVGLFTLLMYRPGRDIKGLISYPEERIPI